MVAGAEALARRLDQLAHARRRGRVVGAAPVPAGDVGGRRGRPARHGVEHPHRQGTARERGPGQLGRAARRADQAPRPPSAPAGARSATAKAAARARPIGLDAAAPGGSTAPPLTCAVVAVTAPADPVQRAGCAQPRGRRAAASTSAWRGARAHARPSRRPERQIVDLAVAEAGQPRRFAARELASALGLLDALPVLAEAIRPRPVPAASGTTLLEWAPYGVVLGWHAANSPVWVPTLVAASALVAGNAVVARPSSRARRTSGRVLAALAGAWPDGCDRASRTCRARRPSRWSGTRASTPWWPTPRARPASATWPASAPPTPAVPGCAPTSPRARATTPSSCWRAPTSTRPPRPRRSGASPTPASCACRPSGSSSSDRCGRTSPRAWLPPSRTCGSGTPTIARTDIGPLAEGPARARARAALAEALARGGRVLVGEGEHGAHFTPTIVRLEPTMRDVALWREESFAPLRALVVAEDAADALALANDTPYALGAARLRVLGRGGRRGRACARPACWSTRARSTRTRTWWSGGVGDSGLAGARPKIEQFVWARRVPPRAGGLGEHAQVLPVDEGLQARAGPARSPRPSRASRRRGRRARPPASR